MVSRQEQSFWPKVQLPTIVLIVGVLLILAVIFARSVSARLDELATSRSENTFWTVSSLEVEYLEFRNRLDRAVALQKIAGQDGEPIRADFSELRVWFDVLFARLNTLIEAPLYREALRDAGAYEKISQAFAKVQGIAAAMDKPDPELAAVLEGVLHDTVAIRDLVRMASIETNVLLATLSEQGRTEILLLLQRLALVTLALISVLAGLAVMFFRLYRIARERGIAANRASERISTILETSPDGVIVTDRAGRITEMNPAARQLFGVADGRLTVAAISDLLFWRKTGEQIEIGPDLFAKHSFEALAERRDGSRFPADISLGHEDTRGVSVVVFFVRDVTARLTGEQDLRLSRDEALAGQRAKSHFMAVMSHEMRTPLNGILGVVELVRDEMIAAGQKANMEILEQSSALLLHHVNDVLDIARFEANGPKVVQSPVDIEKLAADLIFSLRPQAQAGGNRLNLLVDQSARGSFQADAARLRQILSNLLGNAIKFTKDGEITLEVSGHRSSPVQMEFQVLDTGRGIPADKIETVFEDFVRVEAGQEEYIEGSGLGLGIVRRLVDAMGGSFGVESEEGEGSLFWVRVPLERSTQEPVAEDSLQVGGLHCLKLAPQNVLIVEHNAINRLVLRQILERDGHSVREARDGVEGVEAASNQKFDAILMDIQMPRLSGVEATVQIRGGQGPSARTLILALPAHAFPEERDAFLKVGFDNVLTKPVSLIRLREALAGKFVPPVESQGDVAVLDAKHSEELVAAIGGQAFDRALEGLGEQAQQLLMHLQAGRPVERTKIHALAGLAATCGAARLAQLLRQAEADYLEGRLPDWATLNTAILHTLEAIEPKPAAAK